MRRVIETTDDGSATLFVPELNEHYHSTRGALTESRHVFINTGFKASPVPAPRILEIGFGTGLNAWLTLKEAERSGRHVHYTAVELYPLEWSIIEQLNYTTVNEEWFKTMHQVPWEEDVLISPHFTLRKIQADVTQWIAHTAAQPTFNSQLSTLNYHLLYFDAFAPEKQPEMWSEELFHRLYVLLNKGGLLTTYCAKGVVRRMLQSAGFIVERLPGPPGGKREILRALKPE